MRGRTTTFTFAVFNYRHESKLEVFIRTFLSFLLVYFLLEIIVFSYFEKTNIMSYSFS